MSVRASIIIAVGGLVGCFEPTIEDGAVSCGQAGCPPGMACGADNVCRTTGGESSNVVLAVAREDAPAAVLAYCDGRVQEAWSLPSVGSAATVAWAAPQEPGDGQQRLCFGSSADWLRLFAIDVDALSERSSFDWLTQARSVAWADYDNDDDLDLAIADGAESLKVLRWRRGGLQWEWDPYEATQPWGVEWGDADGDGDRDLAVATSTQAAVYRYDGRNDQGDSQFNRAWVSPVTEETRSIAWGDIDRDGDLDLVTGALAGPVRVYTNDGSAGLTESWTSAEVGDTPALAFGDYDGDGDVDLAAAGRDQTSRVYRNDGGMLALAWSTPESQTTWSIEWFDVDGDGDLDLTLGNHGQASRVYRNDRGVLTAWLTLDVDKVRDLSWARWDVPEGRLSACDAARR